MKLQPNSMLYFCCTGSASQTQNMLVLAAFHEQNACYVSDEVCCVSASTPFCARLPKGQTASGSWSGRNAPGARKSPMLPALPEVNRSAKQPCDLGVKSSRKTGRDGYTFVVPAYWNHTAC